MKKRSLLLLVSLLFTALLFAFAACTKPVDPPVDPEEPTYTLSATSISLTVGEEKQLTITPAPETTVTWTSDKESVATVTSGKVVAVAVGSAKVSAKIEGVDAPLTCTVTVTEEPVEVDGYSLNYTELSLKTTETFQLAVLDAEGQNPASITWSSEDEEIATVSTSGLVTAVAVGDTTIKAAIPGGTLSCTVSVTQKYTYTLDKTTVDLAAGASAKLNLIITPDDGNQTSRPVVFESNHPEIATVEGGTGKVTGVAKGTAIITCKVDGETLEATVTVTEYKVKLGTQEFAEEMTLGRGAELDIEITSDPAGHAIEATFESSDDEVFTVDENGHLETVGLGEATLTITVNGALFQATITVVSSYSINYTEYTLNLGGTVRLIVTETGVEIAGVTFESDDTAVATVSANGTVTAVGYGVTTITTRVTGEDDVEFKTTVYVVPESTLAHEDYTFGSGSVNLTYLDENKTIDWRQYYDEIPQRMKNNAGLIGNYVMANGVDDERFWDYKAPVFFEDAEGDQSGVYTYGRAVHGSYTVDVKLTNAVTKVVIFTGSWKEQATIEFIINDAVIKSESFVGGNEALARKYELTIDTSALEADEELTLTIAVNCARANGGNVSLVAVAVIGNEAHDSLATTTTTAQVTTGLTGTQNVSDAGTMDWLAAGGARKSGVPGNSVINASGIAYSNGGQGNTGDDYKADNVTWTEGDSTTTPPTGNRFFRWAPDWVSIPVTLYKGTSTVTLFATGWNAGYLVAVYDNEGRFVNAYQGADEVGNESVTSKVAITLNVPETGEYTFKIMKCRGSGNCGWAAIAVSSESAFEPTQLEYNLALGGSAATIALTGETTGLTYTSANEEVATVDNGVITAVAKGTTYITISDGMTERRVYVTVTEYTLDHSDDLTLSVGDPHQILIIADPDGAFTASYESNNPAVASVDPETGLITANAAGEATITVTIGGKPITIRVTVVSYVLSSTEVVFTLGSDKLTYDLKMKLGESDVDGVKFTSEDPTVASVNENTGEITAVGMGKTTVIAVLGEEAELSCTVIVKLDVTLSEDDYAGGQDYVINLDELDVNATLDWQYFGRGNFTESMKGGAGLIGEVKGVDKGEFYDYRAKMTWTNGKQTPNFVGRTDGWIFGRDDTFGSVSFDVTVTPETKYIAVFTGAWHTKNVITISYGDVVYATYEVENKGESGDNDKNKQVIFTPDTANLGTENKTFTITMREHENGESDHGWHSNLSLVAIAVVGNTARGAKANPAATGSGTQTAFSDLGGSDTIDLSAGTLDWAYAKNGDSGLVRKNTQNPMILEGGIFTTGGDGYDWIGVKGFHWTDGTEEAQYDSLTNFQWINERYQIPVHLTEGRYEVTLYLSGWKCSYFYAVYDGNGNAIVDRTLAMQGDGNNSKQVAVKVTLDVTEESIFTFVMSKEGDGNHGWAAVTVANASTGEPEPEKYELSAEKITLRAGKDAETARLKVLNGKGEEVTGVEIVFNSSNVFVADVDDLTGLITARGVGKTTITVHIGETTLTCEVTVTIPEAEYVELDWDIENLSRASSEYKTIDYKHWNNGDTVMMAGRQDLIGEPVRSGEGDLGNFWDYKGSIGYEFSANSNRNLGMSYGKTCEGSFTLPITINSGVSGIVFYTGAYKGIAVVTFKLGDEVLATVSFLAGNDGIARKIVLNLDTTAITDSQTLTIEGRIESQDGGNINVVALAVIGKEAQSAASATGTATRERLGDTGSNKVDLTEEGSLDWIYSHYEGDKVNDVFPTYHKFGGTVFKGETYYNSDKNTTNPGQEWDGRSAFKWTNGVRSDITDATEGTSNPTDSNEGWAGSGEYTNNYNTANGEIHIGMHLAKGAYTITVYLNSWKADLAAGIYDGDGNFIVGKVCLSNEPGDGSGWVVTFTLDVKEEDDFTLVIGKVRSHDAGDRQVGWQAVSVSEISAGDDQD